MTPEFHFNNSYAGLPDRFYARQRPTPVSAPALVKVNHTLALDLGLDPETLEGPQGVAVLAGNAVPTDATPLSQAYAGHQFGGWSPQLGDGRAVLLGEVIGKDKKRYDIQLKGSGPTPFSRNGDGRAWLGPVLREYIVSEAMHALGVPTTRALAAVTTGDMIYREGPMPGAILTRVASSHIRVGTFQYFAARNDTDALRTLTQYVIDRHYPEADSPLDLLKSVVSAQTKLIAQWMGVGFIHGVMNTDNTHVGGETIDYGPCAFLDTYHPGTVFSSIDRNGRYSYQNQPDIMVWNLAQFATSLIPIMGEDKGGAVKEATAVLHGFADQFKADWLALFLHKIGLTTQQDGDDALVAGLLQMMAEQQADFTNTFRSLGNQSARDQFIDPTAYDAWHLAWIERLNQEGRNVDTARAEMAKVNPAVIPRNHRIEQVIQAAVDGDFAPFERLNAVLASPYETQPDTQDLTRPPEPREVVKATFCGT
ncbi:MAG: protein adenylyltransferase SelO [Pseudoruegeria sp.]